MSRQLDHLVVGARNLEEGAAWCQATFGVPTGPGGQHAFMGTHNRLLRLGGEGFEAAYLEIIAIDPQAPAPGRARWFGLDTPAVQAALAQGPQLLHWVMRSSSLLADQQRLAAAGQDPGRVQAAERPTPTGLLRWQITVPDDGLPRCGGALPTLIVWDGAHPTERMPDSGLSLRQLQLRGLPGDAAALLPAAHVTHLPGPGPALQARLSGPHGEVLLASPFLVE